MKYSRPPTTSNVTALKSTHISIADSIRLYGLRDLLNWMTRLLFISAWGRHSYSSMLLLCRHRDLGTLPWLYLRVLFVIFMAFDGAHRRLEIFAAPSRRVHSSLLRAWAWLSFTSMSAFTCSYSGIAWVDPLFTKSPRHTLPIRRIAFSHNGQHACFRLMVFQKFGFCMRSTTRHPRAMAGGRVT